MRAVVVSSCSPEGSCVPPQLLNNLKNKEHHTEFMGTCSRLLFLISVRVISLVALHSKILASRVSVFILRSSFQNEYYTDRFNEKSAMEILKDEVSSIIQSYVDSKCENPSFKVNPSDLIENSHLLSKGKV